MGEQMSRLMRDFTVAEIKGIKPEKTDYLPNQPIQLPRI